MTPTAMESGTIAEIDGWPGAMNMPRACRDTLDSHTDVPAAIHNLPEDVLSRRSKGFRS